MTFSLIARTEAGETGLAVASRFFAVGAVVPYTGTDFALATQAFVNPMWGVEGADRLRAGEAAAEVLADLAARDAGAAARQAHAIDRAGRAAAHTGADCVDWAGHLAAEGGGAVISVAGNMLAGPQVIDAVRDAFLGAADLPLAERLLHAMQAGEDAGGDKRGRQSAALRVHAGAPYPLLDLRADDDADPLAELRRLLDVAAERYLIFARQFATPGDFSGVADRTETDARIAAREAGGPPSRSRASPPR